MKAGPEHPERETPTDSNIRLVGRQVRAVLTTKKRLTRSLNRMIIEGSIKPNRVFQAEARKGLLP